MVNLSLLLGQNPIVQKPDFRLAKSVNDDRLTSMKMRYVKWDQELPADLFDWRLEDELIACSGKGKFSKHAWDGESASMSLPTAPTIFGHVTTLCHPTY